MRLRILLSTILLWFGLSTATAAEPGPWQHTAAQLHGALTAAGEAYARGDATQAKKAVLQAYFGIFETSKMEAAMRTTMGTRHTYQVESQFGQLRTAIKNGEPQQAVNTRIATLSAALAADGAALDKAQVPAHVFEVNQ